MDEELFAVVARAAGPRLGEFTAQNLANTAWAYSTVGQPDAQLFKALSKEAKQSVGSFSEQDLLTAFSTSGDI